MNYRIVVVWKDGREAMIIRTADKQYIEQIQARYSVSPNRHHYNIRVEVAS